MTTFRLRPLPRVPELPEVPKSSSRHPMGVSGWWKTRGSGGGGKAMSE